jgi:adenylate kinase
MQSVHRVTERPPKVQGCCDRCDGKLFQREDDKSESVKVRLETYTSSTAPLIEFNKKLKLLIPVSATGSAEEICT